MDVFLIVCLVVFIALFIGMNYKIVFDYEHPDDTKLGGYHFMRILLVASILLSQLIVFLLPMDKYNSRDGLAISSWDTGSERAGGIRMDIFWLVLYLLIAIDMILIIPFVSKAYDYFDKVHQNTNRWKRAAIFTAIIFSICAIIIVALYFIFRKVSIPVYAVNCSSWVTDPFSDAQSSTHCQNTVYSYMSMTAGFLNFVFTIFTLAGWFLFATFGGIGLTALPMDLILYFVDRPTPEDVALFAEKSKEMGQQALLLKDQAALLKRKADERANTSVTGAAKFFGSMTERGLKSEYNKLKQSTIILEEQYGRLQVKREEVGQSALKLIASLVGGCICGLLSVCIWLHLLLYRLIQSSDGQPAWLFLNYVLNWPDDAGIFIISLIFYSIFVFYLMACCVKGCFKFGMRFFFLIPIHPMKKDGTYFHAFLFNIVMLLLSSMAVVQFCQDIFADYSNMTDADMLFQGQMKNMKFFGWFFRSHFFEWIFFVWSIICLAYLIWKPRDHAALTSKTLLNPLESEKQETDAQMKVKTLEDEAKKERKKQRDKIMEDPMGAFMGSMGLDGGGAKMIGKALM